MNERTKHDSQLAQQEAIDDWEYELNLYKTTAIEGILKLNHYNHITMFLLRIRIII